MSSNSNNNVSYAKSFQHIAKDTNFGIDPLLPKLKPPAESTKEKKKKRNKAISPRSKTVIPNKAPRVFTSDEYASVFETSVQKFRVNDPIESENIKVEEKEEEPKIQINVENKNEESNSEQIKENISSSDSSSDSSTES
ncbi:hypothetical protein GPJ56_002062 [Histomonas meleagridis]|uniref:uncharacterized protein n=1 Tax=Histomonas meleagridis TaxID=135588 RepID=UPI00355A2DFB|nr:hypothetical protein GPJ56_002062 [Histomonas meleagridis]KAH0800869.1 hypothetical protein GO595_006320 [Histomonas meleagridis]